MTSHAPRSLLRRRLGGFLLLVGGFGAGLAPALAPASVDSELDVPYVQTPDSVVDAMLDLAAVQAGEYVIDLGAGDGRLLIEAARRGAQGFGVDIDPRLVELANRNASAAGVGERARFLVQDLFDTDLSRADVLTVYLLPAVNAKLLPTVLALKPGTRIVSHDYGFGDWQPDRKITVEAPNKPVNAIKTSDLLLFVVPVQAAGHWQGQDEAWTLELTQDFQFVQGHLTVGGERLPITEGRLNGRQLALRAGEGATAITLDATIEGDKLRGGAQRQGKTLEWRGHRLP
ncbi:MAG: class I SAM-dependent methyltransferase [Pigmentiphaga sp.]|nr:class I SAM-dependent methyltransferase [Pigmentiphaga sp.]